MRPSEQPFTTHTFTQHQTAALSTYWMLCYSLILPCGGEGMTAWKIFNEDVIDIDVNCFFMYT
jgi:hypothetical protein